MARVFAINDQYLEGGVPRMPAMPDLDSGTPVDQLRLLRWGGAHRQHDQELKPRHSSGLMHHGSARCERGLGRIPTPPSNGQFHHIPRALG